MSRLRLIVPALLLVLFPVFAGNLLMVRSSLGFPEAMAVLQNAIIKQGYTISRVQRVDVGLTRAKYKTDKYRVVFFGKKKEMAKLTREFPDLIPYLPLKIAIFAEADQAILVAVNPDQLALMYKGVYKAGKLRKYFRKWKKDIRQILKTVANSK